jgi:hypothetical protein
MMAHITDQDEPEATAQVADNGSQPHQYSAQDYQCRDFGNGVCTRGSTCKFMHGSVKGKGGKGGKTPKGNTPKGKTPKAKKPPVYQPQQQPPPDENPAVAQLASVLAQLLGGLSSLTGSSVTAIAGALQTALQQKVVLLRKSKLLEKKAGAYPAKHQIIADTAATVPIAGRDHTDVISDIKLLEQPVILHTANGKGTIREECNIPNSGKLMQRALVAPDCQRSLCPVVAVCEKENLGFNIDPGGETAQFYSKNGKVLPLERKGPYIVLPDSIPENFFDCEEESSEMFFDAQLLEQFETETEEKLHCFLVSAHAATDDFDMNVHCAHGHKPYSAKCPYCLQAMRKAHSARRVPHSDRQLQPGSNVSGDFSGPHPTDVDGNVYAFVGVEMAHSVGAVLLQKSRSALDTLCSIKAFQYLLTVLRLPAIVSWHHDDDSSFQSVVKDYAQEQGWKDTDTGGNGYNPNGNALAERRIGSLNMLVRIYLLVATGGDRYISLLWGVAMKHANFILNVMPWQ